MKLHLIFFIIHGYLSFANPGVLERVAMNRVAGKTAYDVPSNWQQYEVLIATEDCRHVGQPGVLILRTGESYSALVVDCQSASDRARESLTSLGLLGDVNRADIVHEFAALVLVTPSTVIGD